MPRSTGLKEAGYNFAGSHNYENRINNTSEPIAITSPAIS